MRYRTVVGPDHGPALYRDVPGHVGILGDSGEPEPIGTALCVGQDKAGVALWRLIVGDAALPGRWVLIDRRFRPAP
jgi:hypothetical protein